VRQVRFLAQILSAALLILTQTEAAGAQVTVAPRALAGSSVTFVPYDLGGKLDSKPVSVNLVDVTVVPGRTVTIGRNSAILLSTPQGVPRGNYRVRYTFSRLNGANPAVAVRNHSHPDSVIARCVFPSSSGYMSTHHCDADVRVANDTLQTWMQMTAGTNLELVQMTVTRSADLLRRGP
jgi:hypothetical protein